jgi:hypothetical protein
MRIEMQKTIKFNLILLIIFALSINSVEAKDKWWNKIFDKKNKSDNELSSTDIGGAFKQALTIGAENVVSQLGVTDGFNADKSIHIDLPKNLMKVKKILKKVGLSSMVDDLELKLNRAAESAVPVAQDLFISSIQEMTFEDVKTI